MKLWSHGLGKRELKLDFRRCEVRPGPDGSVEILGIITEPVTWEFCITFTPEDVPGMLKLAFNPHMLAMILNHSPSFLGFLLRRKEFAPPEDLAQRVQEAYEQMMNRSGRMAAWKKKRAAQKEAASDAPPPQG